jgi:hypothetical protein
MSPDGTLPMGTGLVSASNDPSDASTTAVSAADRSALKLTVVTPSDTVPDVDAQRSSARPEKDPARNGSPHAMPRRPIRARHLSEVTARDSHPSDTAPRSW